MFALSNVFLSEKSSNKVGDKKALKGHDKTFETKVPEKTAKGHVNLDSKYNSYDGMTGKLF